MHDTARSWLADFDIQTQSRSRDRKPTTTKSKDLSRDLGTAKRPQTMVGNYTNMMIEENECRAARDKSNNSTRSRNS